jgi:hypothetical protein
VIPTEQIDKIKNRLLDIGAYVSGDRARFNSIDEMWVELCAKDRHYGSLLYNAGKLLPEVLALAQPATRFLLETKAIDYPAVVDVNFRIDAPNESKYLFDWHQDYWFSMSSPRAYVAWIPLTGTGPEIGGVEVLDTGEPPRLLTTKPGEKYNSYADAVRLGETLPEGKTLRPDVKSGDILFFSFLDIHKSLPNVSSSNCRWTVQVRIADLADADFVKADYRPSSVKPGSVPFLQGKAS